MVVFHGGLKHFVYADIDWGQGVPQKFMKHMQIDIDWGQGVDKMFETYTEDSKMRNTFIFYVVLILS